MSCIDTAACTCGCCATGAALAIEDNRPGLPALRYRLGTHAEFFARMEAQISSPSLLDTPPESAAWPLSRLSTRSTDDPAIALLDAWAVALDVLTFYQERIANEGFLRTATERRSVLELAREIGYELNPGVAASTYLSFLIEDVIGAAPSNLPVPKTPRTPSAATQGASTYNHGTVLLNTGTQVQSVPPQGQLPQTFETSSALNAQTAWNLMLPRTTRFADYALTLTGDLVMIDLRVNFANSAATDSVSGAECFLLNSSTPLLSATQQVNAARVDFFHVAGVNTGLVAGDLLMFVGVSAATASSRTKAAFKQVKAITPDPIAGITRVDFDGSDPDPGFSSKQFPAATVPSVPVPLTQSSVDQYILLATITESDLQALIRVSGWNVAQVAAMVNNEPDLLVADAMGVYSFAAIAAFFGYNAPLWGSLPGTDNLRGTPYPVDWDASNSGLGPHVTENSQGSSYRNNALQLERAFTVLPRSLAALESDTGALTGLEIMKVNDRSLADFGISGKSTALEYQIFDDGTLLQFFAPCAVLLADGSLASFALSGGSVYSLPSVGSPAPQPTQRMSGGFSNRPAAIGKYPSALEVFAIDDSGNLYHRWHASLSDTGWYGPALLGTQLRGIPSAVSAPQGAPSRNQIDVFAATQSGGLVHFHFNTATGWSAAEQLAASYSMFFTSYPVAVGSGPSALEVFFINGNGILIHCGAPDSKTWWGPAQVVPGQSTPLSGTPAVSAVASNIKSGRHRIDVVALGEDGHLYHTFYDADPWQPLQDLGAPPPGVIYVGDPCMVDGGPNDLEILCVGNDGNLYTTWSNNKGWHGPAALSSIGGLTGSPSAASLDGIVNVTVPSTSGDVFLFQIGSGKNWTGPTLLAGSLAQYHTRTSRLHLNSRQQNFAQPPVTDIVQAGSLTLQLNGFVPGLTVGQAIALTGQRPPTDAAGILSSEVVLLSGIVHHGGFTELAIAAPGLQYSYLRNTLTLNANTVLATNGASIPVAEILGSGDATMPNQSFTLKRTGLTYVPAATPSGSQSSLTIRVNGIAWQQVDSLYPLGPAERCYIAREEDDGSVTVTFGDGVRGARLPSGQNNISAQYRTGIGLAGNVAAGSLSVLQSRPPGLRSVQNVLLAAGGMDPQQLAAARTNAPRTVLTLDRIVSVSDYENFAATFAGIGKAQAVLLPLQAAGFQVIHLTISGGNGAAVDPTSDLYLSLQAAIDRVRDPGPFVHIATYQPATFNLSAALVLDPAYIAAQVIAAATAALEDYFSFPRRDFAQPVYAAEAISVLQSIAGVIAVELTLLLKNGAPPPADGSTVQPVLLAQTAGTPAQASLLTVAAVFTSLVSAELLLLNPVGLTLWEKNA